VTDLPEHYSPPAGLLKDRVVLITGAGDGLGRATALLCARLGATVILAGRTVAKLEAVYDIVRNEGGTEPAIYPLNLAGATWTDYEQLAATLGREFGALHGLVHCAAHFKGFAPLAVIEPQDWLESLQVNLTAPFALTRHCLPLLEKAAQASVVFVSDESGRRGKAYAGAYGVAKFALEGLMQTWAQELEAGGRVRVNSLDPGPMDTALRRRGYADKSGAGDPAAIAPAMAWLLGPDSRPASGRAFTLRR
jgi:NAD(P)-dependent dehydrogenase (short-subunit alcohol dehydrogenase family)